MKKIDILVQDDPSEVLEYEVELDDNELSLVLKKCNKFRNLWTRKALNEESCVLDDGNQIIVNLGSEYIHLSYCDLAELKVLLHLHDKFIEKHPSNIKEIKDL